jgi:hypothetical protein
MLLFTYPQDKSVRGKKKRKSETKIREKRKEDMPLPLLESLPPGSRDRGTARGLAKAARGGTSPTGIVLEQVFL